MKSGLNETYASLSSFILLVRGSCPGTFYCHCDDSDILKKKENRQSRFYPGRNKQTNVQKLTEIHK